MDSIQAAAEPRTRLLEIPVTTVPLVRTPIHVSYLLYLWQFSPRTAWCYWRTAVRLCQWTGIGPSLLLHPLDFLSADDDPDLAFFPAMRAPAVEKIAFVSEVLADFAAPPNGIYAVFPQRKHLPLRVRLWIDFLKHNYSQPEFWKSR